MPNMVLGTYGAGAGLRKGTATFRRCSAFGPRGASPRQSEPQEAARPAKWHCLPSRRDINRQFDARGTPKLNGEGSSRFEVFGAGPYGYGHQGARGHRAAWQV